MIDVDEAGSRGKQRGTDKNMTVVLGVSSSTAFVFTRYLNIQSTNNLRYLQKSELTK